MNPGQHRFANRKQKYDVDSATRFAAMQELVN